MFTVIWTPSANGDYAEIVFAHSNQLTKIEDAGYDINDKLEDNPAGNGQHISEGLWRISSIPLTVFYSIEGNEVRVEMVLWVG